MTFVTDEEQRILGDAVNKAESEGKSLLMPYCCENKKPSHNIEDTATEVSERATEENASGSSPVPETSAGENERQKEETVNDSNQRPGASDSDTATAVDKDMMRGKPYITDVKINPKIYVNRNLISKFNLDKDNLASKNKNKNNDNNCSTVLQEQL